MEARNRPKQALDRRAFGLDRSGDHQSPSQETVDRLARAMSDATVQADEAGPDEKTLLKKLAENLDLTALAALTALGVLSSGVAQEIIKYIAR